MITYRAIRDVPRALAHYVGRLLQAERRVRATRRGSRALTCFAQAVFGLRWFRQNVEVSLHDHGLEGAMAVNESARHCSSPASTTASHPHRSHRDGA